MKGLLVVAVSLQLLLLSQLSEAQGAVVSLACEASTCQECVTKGCGWAPALKGACLRDCSTLADAPCYSSKYNPDLNATQVCEYVDKVAKDDASCASKQSCAECVETSTALSGGESCSRHKSQGLRWCQRQKCSLLGCGSTTCPP